MRAWSTRILVMFAVSLMTAGWAIGDEFHYVNILIGERAAGMGGATIGLSDDAMACYHNPGALAQITEGTMSVSASLLDLRSITYEKYFYSKDLTFVSLDFVPSGWGATVSLWGGQAGFSIVVPDSNSFRVYSSYDGGGFQGTLQMKGEGRMYLLGPTYAHSLTDRLSLGGTIYLSYRTADQRSNIAVSDPSGHVEYITTTESSSLGLLVHLGLLFRATENLSVGAVYRSDSTVSSSGYFQQITYTTTSPTSSTYTRSASFERRDARLRTPSAYGLGIAYRFNKPLILAGDIFYHDQVTYESLGQTVHKIAVWNWNLGLEYGFLDQKLPLRFGIYSNNTSAPRLNTSPEPQPNHIDIWGWTLSVGWRTTHTSTSFGIQASTGRGETKDGAGQIYTATASEVALLFAGSYWF